MSATIIEKRRGAQSRHFSGRLPIHHATFWRHETTALLVNPRVERSLGAALLLLLASCSSKAPPAKPGPPKQEDTPIYDEFVGTLDGSVNASIEARVQVYLTSRELQGKHRGKEGRTSSSD